MSDLSHLIQDSIDLVDIEPELATIENIDENVKRIEEIRNRKMHVLEKSINQLQEEIENYQREISILKTVSDINTDLIESLDIPQNQIRPGANIFKVLSQASQQIDNKKFKVATSVIELESQANSLTIKKNELSSDLHTLRSNVEKSRPLNSKTILKLNFYKNLDVTIDTVDNKDHISVYNKEKNLLVMLTVDDNILDRFIQDYIWERI